MSSVFGVLFRVATWGESHGGGVGAVVDGCPPRIPLTATDIQADLDRRRPGQSEIVSPRDEEDKCQILSGVFEGLTLITPTRQNMAFGTGRAAGAPRRAKRSAEWPARRSPKK